MHDRPYCTLIQPGPVTAESLQRHVCTASREIRQQMRRLASLSERLVLDSTAPTTASELQQGIRAVCNDLLDDAAETLTRLGTMTPDDVVRRHLEASDLAERLASHGAA